MEKEMEIKKKIKDMKAAIVVLAILLVASIALIIQQRQDRNKNQLAVPGTPLFKAALDTISPELKVYSVGDKLFRSINELKAASNVGAYRHIRPEEEGLGVYYDSSDVSYYATEIFPKLVAAQERYMKATGVTYPPEFKWKVGFYWMLNKDTTDGLTKYDFCVVPILVNEKNPKERFEYFNVGDKKYDHNPTIMLRRRAPGAANRGDSQSIGNIFNTGTMFP
ncbi:MAG TPA: hypothetical protein VFR58_05085 [Flavisolibacter sp.]|nr:hypothetical protein [Flavisolibacter sp.]